MPHQYEHAKRATPRMRVVLMDASSKDELARQRALRRVQSITADGERPLLVMLRLTDAAQLQWLEQTPCDLAVEEHCIVEPTDPAHAIVGRVRVDPIERRIAFLPADLTEPKPADWVELPHEIQTSLTWSQNARGMLRRALRIDVIAVVIATAWVVAMLIPAPWVALSTVPPVSVDDFVVVKPAVEGSGVDGQLLVGRVSDRQVRWGELPYWAVRATLDADLQRTQTQLGDTRRDLVQDPQELLELGRQNAIVAALDALGEEFEYAGDGVIVDQSNPRFGVDNGDHIVRAGGTPIATELDLWRVIDTARPGDRIPVRLLDGRTSTLLLEPDPSVRAGFQIPRFVTANATLRHDVDLQTPPTNVVGDSNGLAVALQVFDTLSERDVLQGRTIMATGAMRPSGVVTAVGGVPQKVLAAYKAGVDLVIVPERNVGEATAALPAGATTRIVAVSSLADAIARLDPAGEEGGP